MGEGSRGNLHEGRKSIAPSFDLCSEVASIRKPSARICSELQHGLTWLDCHKKYKGDGDGSTSACFKTSSHGKSGITLGGGGRWMSKGFHTDNP